MYYTAGGGPLKQENSGFAGQLPFVAREWPFPESCYARLYCPPLCARKFARERKTDDEVMVSYCTGAYTLQSLPVDGFIENANSFARHVAGGRLCY